MVKSFRRLYHFYHNGQKCVNFNILLLLNRIILLIFLVTLSISRRVESLFEISCRDEN